MARHTGWLPLVDEALGVPIADEALQVHSFVALGGTSLQAIGLVASGQRQLGRDADVAAVLSERPLGEVLAEAREFTKSTPPPATEPGHRDPLPGQKAMLAAHVSGQDLPYHLMFTLAADAPLDLDRTRAVLGALAARHESLRTMFVHGERGVARVVLPAPHQPRLLLQTLPDGADAIATVHDLFGRDSGTLLRPFDMPPLVFVHTSAGERGLLTVLVHHVLADGWSIGLLLRDFAELYAGREVDAAASPEWVGGRLAAMTSSGGHAAALRRVTARLAGAPMEVALPTDLPPMVESDGRGARLVFTLSPDATSAAEILARRARATVPTVLLSTWSLTVARRAGVGDLVLGVPAAGRFEAGMEQVVGLCTRVVPVRCRISGQVSPAAHVRMCAAAVAAAVADADVPFEDVVTALGRTENTGHNPVAQVGFAAHHELVPATVAGWTVHEGHCGGAVFDALLYLQAWLNRPRLALEFATSALTAADAGELAESFQATLVQLATASMVDQVTGLSAAQTARLAELGAGGEFATADDLWSAFARHAEVSPDAPAAADEDESLTYAELHDRALAQAAALHASGVRSGDRVLLDVRRSVAEAAAVLAIARLGAAYVAVDRTATPKQRAHLRTAATPKARIADGPACAEWADIPACAIVTASDPDTVLPAHRPDPAHTAYVSFTSGSTGTPKGVVVPHRAVLRLAADPDLFVDSARTCLLRLAPMAFDASTLELLVPLASGHAVRVYPPGEPTAQGIADFLRDGDVTHMWLTSGLFHLVAEHRPDAFAGLRQVFTGGGVVSPRHVRRVLDHCPGLRVTNGYGPTENTTFTTTFHVDAAAEVPDPLPIGTPVHGTSLQVVDPAGRLVPRGAVGELLASGPGLADGYLAEPDRTAAVFTGDGYRTGDLVRWDGHGRLRFLGRNDKQVKIAGHRVELADVERLVRDQPGVLDAVVFLAGDEPTTKRLCAALTTEPGTFELQVARSAVEARLAPYARPQMWYTVAEFPLDRNGKVDLRALAVTPSAPNLEPPPPPTETSLTDLESLVADAWTEALSTDDFDIDEGFFDVGGDSLSLAVARKLIQRRLGGRRLSLTDMYRFPTVQSLARHLHEQPIGTLT